MMFKRVLNITLISSLLSGFTGHERRVELTGVMHGRDSASFVGKQNVSAILTKGTVGEILEHKQLPSGNYALFIEVKNSANKNKKFWVYYNNSKPTMKLFKTVDEASTPDATLKAQDSLKVLEARAGITTEVTPAHQNIPAIASTTKTKPLHEPLRALEAAQIKVAQVNEAKCNGKCQNETTTKAIENTVSLISKKSTRALSSRCNSIMTSKGEMNEVGSQILGVMAEDRYKPVFTRPSAMGSLCPKFSHLTDEQKLYAWTWFWTALASEESTCRADVEHPVYYKNKQGKRQLLNPYPGYGLWALEKDANLRAGRGDACKNIRTAEGQARCSIDIMAKTIRSKGTADIRSGSYWGPIHRASTQIIPHMRRLSLCF